MLLNIKRQTSLCNHTVKLSLFSYSAEKINMAASVLGQLADCLYVYTFLTFYVRMFGWRWGHKP